MSFENKFNLTVDENIFVAKRNIIDYIWKSARLEGLGVTFPETEAIYNGMRAPNVKVGDIIAVNNLKHAWQFLFDTVDCPTDFPYICELNRIVGGDNLIYNSGYLRNIPVAMGGTTWKPDMPVESEIRKQLMNINRISQPVERAITLMLYCMRSQMFVDGNKRTSMLAANHEMIINGCGIISVPIEIQPIFTQKLVDYYESNDMDELKQFVYDYCVDGLDLRAQEKATKERLENADDNDEQWEG